MSSHCNPNIVEDGLVFLYDVDDIQSYKGEPTENIALTEMGISLGQNFSSEKYFCTTSIVNFSQAKYGNGVVWKYAINRNNGRNWFRSLNSSASGGSTWTFSYWVYNPNNITVTMQVRIFGRDSNSTIVTNEGSNITCQSLTWTQVYLTTTLAATATQIGFHLELVNEEDFSVNDFVYLDGIQLEEKSHVTQFTTGTRSATQGLLDRTGTSTIDISNASFGSNAQMTFDGTDDYISAASFDMGTPTEITVECVIRFNGSLDSADRKVMHYNKSGGTNAVFQLRKGDSNSRLYYQAHNGSQWYTMTDTDAIESDTWAHFIITHSGTSAIMYKNGVQSATATMGNLEWTNANDLLIGYRTNSEYWKGDIAIMKIYNKALTSTEILQNYNAIKSRFSL